MRGYQSRANRRGYGGVGFSRFETYSKKKQIITSHQNKIETPYYLFDLL